MKKNKVPPEPELKICAGYKRKPHNAPIALELQYPDGRTVGLCQICQNRWLLSDEEWPPTEGKTSIQTNPKVVE